MHGPRAWVAKAVSVMNYFLPSFQDASLEHQYLLHLNEKLATTVDGPVTILQLFVDSCIFAGLVRLNGLYSNRFLIGTLGITGMNYVPVLLPRNVAAHWREDIISVVQLMIIPLMYMHAINWTPHFPITSYPSFLLTVFMKCGAAVGGMLALGSPMRFSRHVLMRIPYMAYLWALSVHTCTYLLQPDSPGMDIATVLDTAPGPGPAPVGPAPGGGPGLLLAERQTMVQDTWDLFDLFSAGMVTPLGSKYRPPTAVQVECQCRAVTSFVHLVTGVVLPLYAVYLSDLRWRETFWRTVVTRGGSRGRPPWHSSLSQAPTVVTALQRAMLGLMALAAAWMATALISTSGACCKVPEGARSGHLETTLHV